MGQATATRIAVAGPISLLAAMLSLDVAAALSDMASWPVLAIVPALLPVALCFWLRPESNVAGRAALCVTTISVSIGVGAAVFLLRVPLLDTVEAVVSGSGHYMAFWAPIFVVLVGSFVARSRSGSPLFGLWLLWWIPVVAGTVWAESLALFLTGLASVDSLAGAIAALAAPTWGMSAWLGATSVHHAHSRFTRGHVTMASTPTSRGSEVV